VIVRDGPTPTMKGGALYVVGVPLAVDVGDRLPHGKMLPQYPVDSFRLQATPPRLGSLATFAVNCVPCDVFTVADAGKTVTVMVPAANTVMIAFAVLLGSDAEVAFNVTVAGTGTVVGAV
jgi:hypothetical protein